MNTCNAAHGLLRALLFVLLFVAAVSPARSSEVRSAEVRQQALSPAVFVENKGQWDKEVRFGLNSGGMSVRLTDSEIAFTATKRDGDGKDAKASSVAFTASFKGAEKATIEALDPSPAKMNFYSGSDKSKWQTGVSTYKRVVYRGVYEGIDLYVAARPGGLKYEFNLKPGANARDIVMRYEGIEGLSIDSTGALCISTSLGEIVDAAPVVYQQAADGRKDVIGHYKLVGDREYGFEITGEYDHALPLVIDPEIAWGSYLGSNQCGRADTTAIDSNGDTWVGGFIDDDGFVAKISPAGELLWTVSVKGAVTGMAMSSQGCMWVVGTTRAPDFPVTDNAFRKTYQDADPDWGWDSFVMQLSLAGEILFASYLGGNGVDGSPPRTAVAVDAQGNAWISGITESGDFPTPGGFRTGEDLSHEHVLDWAPTDGFLVKVTPAGQLAWGSLIGGNGPDYCVSTTVDSTGAAWVLCTTSSSDIRLSDGSTTSGIPGLQWDAVLMRIAPSGQLSWTGCIDQNIDPNQGALAVDTSDDVIVTCCDALPPDATNSAYFLVAKVAPSGQTLWEFFLTTDAGGPSGVSVDGGGAIYIGGMAGRLLPAPNVPPAEDDCWRHMPGFVARITPSGQLGWAYFIRGLVWDVAVDSAGNPWVCGAMDSAGEFFPLGFQQTFSAGSEDGFILRMGLSPPTIQTASLHAGIVGDSYSATLACTGDDAPFTWRVTSGVLPTGLSLNASSGVISGTPRAANTWHFTVEAMGTDQKTGDKDLSITVTALPDDGGPALSGIAVVPSTVREKVDTSITLTAAGDSRRCLRYTVASVEYRIGVGTSLGPWTAMAPADGAYDSQWELATATIDTSGWRVLDGPRTIYVRAHDSAGRSSIGTPSITVSVIDGTAPGRVYTLSLTPTADLETILTGSWQTPGRATAAQETKTFDLGSLRAIGGVGLIAATTRLFPKRLTIEVSADSSDWRTITSHTDYRAVKGANVWQFDSDEYRYVRLTATGVYSPAAGCYQVDVPAVNILGRVDGGKLRAKWMASADDGYDASSGWTDKSDLRYSSSVITDSNFQSCRKVEAIPASVAPGKFVETVFGTGDLEGTVFGAVKVIDASGNPSPLSNVEQAQVGYMGLSYQGESDLIVTNPSLPPQLVISRGKDVTQAFIAFSGTIAFPKNHLKFPIKVGKYTWSPAASQWKAIKKRASTLGAVYWRLEGKSLSCPSIILAPKELMLRSGDITSLAVSPVHGDNAIWPDATKSPTFSWTNGIPGMAYFWVDISTDSTFATKSAKKLISLTGTSGSATASRAQWKAIRRLAATNTGALYWRVRAKDHQKVLTLASETQTLTIDGGTWTVSDVTSTPDGPMISWQHQGEGIATYRLEFGATESFGGKPGTTVVVPPASITATSYTLKAAEVTRLRALAKRAGVATLRYRVRGQDAERAFLAHSEAKTTAVP